MALRDLLRRRPDERDPAGDRWLVVGLGNPEAEYGGTRHNIGADVVRRLAERLGATFKPHKKAQAQVADTFFSQPGDQPGAAGVQAPGGFAGTPLSLVIPFGYMNTSGGGVQQAMAFYKVAHDRLVVAHDDLDLPVGALRLKRGGGDGGHRGLQDIRRRTGSGDYHRVRLGIGRPPGRQDPADYVLRRFGTREREEVVDVTVERACDAILDVVAHGLDYAQNRHHAASP